MNQPDLPRRRFVILAALFATVVTPIVVGLLANGHDFSGALIYVSASGLLGLFAYLFLVGEIGREPIRTRLNFAD